MLGTGKRTRAQWLGERTLSSATSSSWFLQFIHYCLRAYKSRQRNYKLSTGLVDECTAMSGAHRHTIQPVNIVSSLCGLCAEYIRNISDGWRPRTRTKGVAEQKSKQEEMDCQCVENGSNDLCQMPMLPGLPDQCSIKSHSNSQPTSIIISRNAIASYFVLRA